MKNTKHDTIDKLLIVLIALYNLGVLFISILWLFTNSFKGYKHSLSKIDHLEINETVTYGLFFAGALGGAFYCLRGLYQRLGEAYTPVNGKEPDPKGVFNVKVWFFWYFYRPIQGGVLALICLALLNSSLLSIKELNSEQLKSFYTLIAVGFLAGFGSHELIHKVQEIIQVVFAKSKVTTSSNSETKVKENNGN